MGDRLEINKLDNSTNTNIATQVGGSAVVQGSIRNDQSTHHYNAQTLNLYKNEGQLDSINFGFNLETLQGIIANRDAELERMRAVLAKPTTGSGAKMVVLVGMGGTGKTTLAKMYFKAENDRERFDYLIWIGAEELENVTAAFKQLFANLNVDRQVCGDEQLITAVYDSILKRKAIIVFDNVEQVEHIRKFFPKLVLQHNPCPHVIVTTRNSAGWQDYKGHLVHVGELSMPVCKDYIRDTLATLKITDVDSNSEELAEHFGRLVMALRTATMSIVEQNYLHDANDQEPYTLKDFLDEVKTTVVEEEETHGLDSPVEATYRPLRQLWSATLNRLSQQPYGQVGERVLEVLALLSSTGVPIQWFRIICAEFLGTSDRIMMQATLFLISWSLVETSESKYLVHRVFQTTLLSRIKSNPEKLNATFDWLLPAISQLRLKLAGENKLGDFYPHLHTLVKNIDLRGIVPDSVVSFLINMKLSGSYICQKLLEELVEKKLKKVVTVSHKSLERVLTLSGLRNSILLLPNWIRDCNVKMPIQEQLRLIQASLTPISIRQLYPSIVFYSVNLQVMEKWKPEFDVSSEDVSAVQPELDVLIIVGRLCHGLDQWINAVVDDVHIKYTTYEEIYTVLQRLKNVLNVALTAVFEQSKSDNLETKFKSVDVVFKWFLTLANFETRLKGRTHKMTVTFSNNLDNQAHMISFQSKIQLCIVTELESVFRFFGVERVMIQWYQIKLHQLYRAFAVFCSEPELQLEAKFIAAAVAIMVRSLSYPEQPKAVDVPQRVVTSEAKIPMQVIQVLNCFEDRESMLTGGSVTHPLFGAYFLYLALEPHLDLLEHIRVRLEEPTDDVHRVQNSVVAIESFAESLKRNLKRYKTRGRDERITPLFDYSEEPFAYDHAEIAKNIFPRGKKLTEAIDKILARYSDLRRSLALPGSNPCNLEKLVEKLEDDYDCYRGSNKCTEHPSVCLMIKPEVSPSEVLRCLVGLLKRRLGIEPEGDPCNPEKLLEYRCVYLHEAHESNQLQSALNQAYKAAEAAGHSSDTKNCGCFVARIQTMLAGLDLEQGNTEVAIQLGLEAFNHQHYCNQSNNMDRTLGVLLDAFRKCENSQSQTSELLRRLSNSHMHIHGPNSFIAQRSHMKLIRFLCSTGSMLEAADCSEEFMDSSSFPPWELIYDNNEILTVALLLLMSGENERVVSITERILRNVTATNIESHQEDGFDKICCFSTLLSEVARSFGPTTSNGFEFSVFRKCALIFFEIHHPHLDDGKPPIYQEWLDDKVQFLRVHHKRTNKEETSLEKRRIRTTKLLDWDTLLVLWFDTMEQVLHRSPDDAGESLFEPLVRQLKLRNLGMGFKLIENALEWSVKCFVGMFQGQQLWFQKTNTRTDEAMNLRRRNEKRLAQRVLTFKKTNRNRGAT